MGGRADWFATKVQDNTGAIQHGTLVMKGDPMIRSTCRNGRSVALTLAGLLLSLLPAAAARKPSSNIPATASFAGASYYRITGDGSEYVDGQNGVLCIFGSHGDFYMDTVTRTVNFNFDLSEYPWATPCGPSTSPEAPGPRATTMNVNGTGGQTLYSMSPGSQVLVRVLFNTDFSLKFGAIDGSDPQCSDYATVTASYDPTIGVQGPGGANTWVVSNSAADLGVAMHQIKGKRTPTSWWHLPFEMTVKLKQP
jgi:hypothetical protein